MNPVLRLLSFLWKHWRIAVLSPLCMMVEVGMDLLLPLLLARIIDYGVVQGDVAYILRVGLLMLGLAVIGLAGGMGGIVASSIASQRFGADLRLAAFTKVQSFSFAKLDEFRTPSLITRLTNDITQVQHTVMMMLRAMIRAPLLALGGLAMAATLNPGLSLIILVTIPLLAGTLWVVINKSYPLFALVQERIDRVNAVMRENLVGVRVVKAFVRGDKEKERFRDANEQLARMNIRASRVVSTLMPIMMLVMNASIVAILWFGGIKVDTGEMTVGQVMAFINYVSQILFALMLVVFVLMALSRAKASASRINEILTAAGEIRETTRPVPGKVTRGEIVFEKVYFQYPGAGAPVLENINLHIKPGHVVGIIGGTGAGKTTLSLLIPRFYDVTRGRVLVDGVDVRDYRLNQLRSGIGIVPQEITLFSGTVAENIRWGREDAAMEEIIRAAQAAQAHEFIMSLPDGYDTVLGQRGVNLSGGQKQRLAIARALLRRPAVLILDDSTSALDAVTEAKLRQSLKEYLGPCTRIVISQKISSVMEADQIIVLDNGVIEATGTHAGLLAQSSLYRDIYRSQWGQEVAADV